MRKILKKTISVLMLLGVTAVISMSSCKKDADIPTPDPTPSGHLTINSEKRVTEDPTKHQMIVNVSSNVKFKYAVKDKSDWIIADGNDSIHDKGDSVKIAFNLTENVTKKDRNAVLLFATADNNNFTDTVYVKQNAIGYITINSDKNLTENPTAHQIKINVTSNVSFKYEVKDSPDWITSDSKEHPKRDKVDIAFNLTENATKKDRTAKLIFGIAGDKNDFTDTVKVTQTASYLEITSNKNPSVIMNDHSIIVKVNSGGQFSFSINEDASGWIIADKQQNIYTGNQEIKFNLNCNGLNGNRVGKIVFTTTDKIATQTVTITQSNTINVATPGTLEQEIKNAGIADPLTIQKLTVLGTLNSTDIICLRAMAGGGMVDIQKTAGQLSDLDISNISLVDNDPTVYYTYTLYGDNNYSINKDNPGDNGVVQYMFSSCNRLKTIAIQNTAKKIPIAAFNSCTGLTKITIPSGVTSIEDEAFFNCESLHKITIPNGVTSIGEYVFQRCLSLTNITIPSSVTLLGNSPFYSCLTLSNIYMRQADPTNIRFGNKVFNDINRNATLYVPGPDAVTKYKAIQQLVDIFKDNIVVGQ